MSDPSQPLYQASPTMFRHHPLLFVFWLLVSAAGVAMLVSAPERNWKIAGFGALFTGVFALLFWLARAKTTQITVTDRDVVLRSGLLSRSSTHVALGSIRTVNVYQSLMHRIFGVGNLEIFTAGDEPEISIGGIPHPGRARDLLRGSGRAHAGTGA